jgi:DNA polymerase/3'-5' exonuclease PolX
MNAKLKETLLEISDIYRQIGEPYRARAYYQAAHGTIAAKSSILPKIEEFKKTGKFALLEELRQQNKLFIVFTGIMGVGPSIAKSWLAKGYKTISDVQKAVKSGKLDVTPTIALGIKYYDDLRQRIPRAEVAAVAGKLMECIFPLVHRWAIAGSYRRQVETSGDIDLLVSTDSAEEIDSIVEDLDDFVFVSGQREKYTLIYTGGKIARHVDLLIVDDVSFAAALLYFTVVRHSMKK